VEKASGLFSASPGHRSALDVILWWELRRLSYNLIVGCVGLCSFAFFGLALGCSVSFENPPNGEGGYCNKAWAGVPCQAGLVCNTFNICQQPVPAGGECLGDVCGPEFVCVVDDLPSTTASGVCLPCAWAGTCNDG
jgi:hypothetical protein